MAKMVLAYVQDIWYGDAAITLSTLRR